MTTIAWTEKTWNPTTGCDRTSPGCDSCYALTMAARLKAMGQAKYQRDGDPRTSGPGFGLTLHPDTLGTPARWRTPTMVFVNSMSDLFHPEVPVEFIAQVFAAMAMPDTTRHIFQVLTKRAQRMAAVLSAPGFPMVMDDHRGGPAGDFHWPLENVWLGVSIENDRYAFRADHLRATPAAIRWVSAEPLLGPLDELDLAGVDWLVAGGESGRGARPMDPGWVRDLRDRCAESGTAFFFKQTGSVLAREWGCTGKGEQMGEWPADLQVRQYPTVGTRP